MVLSWKLALMGAFVFLASPARAQTIVDVISRDQQYRFGPLITLLTTARLTNTLDGPGPYTLFAPTLDAFIVSKVNATKLLQPNWGAHLNDLLTFHVSSETLLANQLTVGKQISTVQGEEYLSVTSGPDPLVLNDNSTIIEADLTATNGVVHVIDYMLLPTSARYGIYEYAKDDPEFSTLAELIEKAGLVEALSGPGPRTIFAPPNSAFDSMQGFGWNNFINDQSKVRNLLLYHLVDGIVFADQMKDLESMQSVQGSEIQISVVARRRSSTYPDFQIKLNLDSTVTATDTLVNTGVFHTIDRVLTPPDILDPTVAGLLLSQGLTTFEDAAKRTGLWDTLNNPSEEFTAFAAVNSGFSPDFDIILSNYQYYRHLKAAMDYQVVAGQALWTGDMAAGKEMPTLLEGQSLTVTQGHPSRPIILNYESVVQVSDLVGSNGALHIVDQVMPPPFLETNVIDVIARQPSVHSTMIYLLVLTGLIPELSAEGPFTVFAPTNRAFIDLLFDSGALTGYDWTSNLDTMKEILRYHVVPEVLYQEQMMHGTTHTTWTGATLDITDTSYTIGPVRRRLEESLSATEIASVPPVQIVLNGKAIVLNSDQFANNGVVHTIDSVLIPPIDPLDFGAPTQTDDFCVQYGGFERLCCPYDTSQTASYKQGKEQNNKNDDWYCEYMFPQQTVEEAHGVN